MVFEFIHELHPGVQLEPGSLHGSLSFFNPTHAVLKHSQHPHDQKWNSRDHRKQRHRLEKDNSSRLPRSVLHGIFSMLKPQYWNISWWVAFLYTLGSIVWVVNGFASFLEYCDGKHFGPAPTSSGWTAWLGATIFEIASLLLPLEAWNRADAAMFGWNLVHVMDPKGEEDAENNKKAATDTEVPPHDKQKWIWWSTSTKYWHELGFVAGIVQLAAASIFWISGFTAIPQIQSAIKEHTALENGIFWTPQVIGGSGFMISGVLYMLETQERWFKFEPLQLGWQIAFWNIIGGTGFMLCGALGYAPESNTKAAYQSALSTFWGGWAFLVGSLLQLYEAVNARSASLE